MTELDQAAYHLGVLRGYFAGREVPGLVLEAVESLYLAARGSSETRQSAAATCTSEPAATQPSPERAVPPPGSRQPESDEAKVQAFLTARAINSQPVAETPPLAQPEKQRNGWTPEARAAQAQRMRERHAAGTMKRSDVEKSGERTAASEPLLSAVQGDKAIERPRVANPMTVSLARPTPLSEPPQPHRLSVSHPDWAGKREDSQLHDSDWPDIKEMVIKGRTHLSIASDFDVEPETLKAFIEAKLKQGREGAEKPPGEARAPAA